MRTEVRRIAGARQATRQKARHKKTPRPTLTNPRVGHPAAIALAESLGADLLLIDERAGAILAQRRGLAVTGTLGILDLASRAGLLRLRDVFERLRGTNFRYPPPLVEKLLHEERNRGQ